MAKPYSTGHIGAVASNFTEMRLSGAVKQQLVELACDEIQRFVPEMGTITGKENKVIILTSNNTRELSDALRRRCIYLYLDFPNIEIEKKVLMNTVEGISEDEAIKYASLIAFVRNLNLNKIPSLIESIEWVKFNIFSKSQTDENLGILLKDKSDHKLYLESMEHFNESNNK